MNELLNVLEQSFAHRYRTILDQAFHNVNPDSMMLSQQYSLVEQKREPRRRLEEEKERRVLVTKGRFFQCFGRDIVRRRIWKSGRQRNVLSTTSRSDRLLLPRWQNLFQTNGREVKSSDFSSCCPFLLFLVSLFLCFFVSRGFGDKMKENGFDHRL